jgi:hypothetical protein
MGLVSLVARLQSILGFAPTASTVVLGEKLGTDPRIGQSSYYGLGREFFSWEQWSCSTLLMPTQKAAMY